jgi:hypothetical protein
MKFLLATRLQQDETPGTVTVEMNKIRFPYVPENFPRSFTRAAREFCPHSGDGSVRLHRTSRYVHCQGTISSWLMGCLIR